MSGLTLYHAGFQVIERPEVRHGRRNADFGPGFYCSDDASFCRRWAQERRDEENWLNVYALETEGLNLKRFARDGDWYDYIFRNRTGYPDALADYDVIIGPIANDTIYDTLGLSTSGLLPRALALELLLRGPEYTQVVVKTDRAAAQLRFVTAERLSAAELAAQRALLRQEEETYQNEFAALLEQAAEQMEGEAT